MSWSELGAGIGAENCPNWLLLLDKVCLLHRIPPKMKIGRASRRLSLPHSPEWVMPLPAARRPTATDGFASRNQAVKWL